MPHRIMIVGAGYAGMRVALDLGHTIAKRPGVEVTLFDRNPYHQFRTELHKAAAGTAGHEVSIPIENILDGTGVRFVQEQLTHIDVKGHRLAFKSGREVGFDQLVVSLGSEPAFFNIPGLEHALTITSVNSARTIRDHINASFMAAARTGDPDERRRLLTVVVGGGGLTGVEFVFEVADRIPELCKDNDIPQDEARLILIEASAGILKGFDPSLIEKAKQRLESKHIEAHLGVKITKVEPGRICLENGHEIATGSFIWTGGVKGDHLVGQAMTSDKRSRADVNEYLQSVDSHDVFVGGDSVAAKVPGSDQVVPPTAQNAIQQGALIAKNVAACLTDEPLQRYDPKNLGMIVSLGEGYGVANFAGMDISGLPAAWLKELVTLHYLYSLGGPKLLLQQLVHA